MPGPNVPAGVDPLLLCDWNGTLVDDEERAREAISDILRARDLPDLGTEEFRERFRLPLADFFADLGLVDLGVAVEEWNDNLARTAPRPNAGAREMLEYVATSGIVVGVVSAARTDVVRADVAALGFDEHISFVLGGVESKSEILTAIVASSARSVAYLGDTEYDMHSAEAAGAVAIGYSGGYRPASALWGAGAQTVVGNLQEVGYLMLDGQAPRRKADQPTADRWT
jgi:phosphoglycolate phosphatase